MPVWHKSRKCANWLIGGEPLQLVDGLGRVWGSWVIVEVGDTRSVLMDDGQPRRVGFEVKLKAYGEDETVTDYSGGWSPFAVLSVIDSVLTDPIGALDDLLGSLPGLLNDLGIVSEVTMVAAIQTALKELLATFGASYQKEAPRLCRGGSRSLTFQEVVHRRDFQS